MNVTKSVVVNLKDGQKLFGYTVAKSKKDHYSFMLKEGGGLAHIPQEEIENVNEGGACVVDIDKPKMEGVSATPKGERKPREKGAPSKADQAYDLLKDKVATVSRKECIGILMEELGMSQAGASTYHANVKKKVAAQ